MKTLLNRKSPFMVLFSLFFTMTNIAFSRNFSQITTGSIVSDGGFSLGCHWGDFDNDGDIDLFVANGGWYHSEANFLYTNNGDGTFTNVTTDPFVSDIDSSYGGTWSDYNNDGYLDLFFANGLGQNNALYLNNGDE